MEHNCINHQNITAIRKITILKIVIFYYYTNHEYEL